MSSINYSVWEYKDSVDIRWDFLEKGRQTVVERSQTASSNAFGLYIFGFLTSDRLSETYHTVCNIIVPHWLFANLKLDDLKWPEMASLR